MQNILFAGLGGFVGTILRYLLNNFIYSLLEYPLFPYGTCLINVSGCFIIGLLAGLAETRLSFSPELRIFLFIGVLGGFTTFSTFGYETFNLFRDGQTLLSISNILLQVLLGLFAVWAGYHLGQ